MLKRIARGVLVTAIITVAFVLCLEGMCRVVQLSNDTMPVDFVADPYLPYRLRPNSDVKTAFGVPITTNSLGLRDREYSLEKPAGVTRILAIGDSQTFGYGVPTEDTFAKQLERALLEAGYKVEVIDAGVDGYTTGDQVQYLEHYGLALKPDLVVYGIANASFAGTSLKLEIRDGIGYEASSLQIPPWVKKILRRSRLYLALAYVRVGRMHGPGAQSDPTQFFEKRWSEWKSDFDALLSLCKARSIPLTMAYLPVRQEMRLGRAVFPGLLERLKAVRADGFEFVDVLAQFLRAGNEDKWFLRKDCCHHTRAGHGLISEQLKPLVVARLQAPYLSNPQAVSPR